MTNAIELETYRVIVSKIFLQETGFQLEITETVERTIRWHRTHGESCRNCVYAIIAALA